MYIVQFLKDECICLRMWVFLTVLLSQIFKVLIWSLEFDIYAIIRKYKFQVNFPISMCFKDYDKLYIRRLCIKIVFDIQMQHLTKLKWISHPKRNVYKHWEKWTSGNWWFYGPKIDIFSFHCYRSLSSCFVAVWCRFTLSRCFGVHMMFIT